MKTNTIQNMKKNIKSLIAFVFIREELRNKIIKWRIGCVIIIYKRRFDTQPNGKSTGYVAVFYINF